MRVIVNKIQTAAGALAAQWISIGDPVYKCLISNIGNVKDHCELDIKEFENIFGLDSTRVQKSWTVLDTQSTTNCFNNNQKYSTDIH